MRNLLREVWYTALFVGCGILIGIALMVSQASHAQTNSCQVSEALPNDQFITVINGKAYHSINADKMRELLQMKADLAEKTALLENANQQIAVQQKALDAVQPALTACTELTTKFEAFAKNEQRRDEQFNVTLNRFDLVQQRQNEALDAAAAALKPGRIRQLQENPWFQIPMDYLGKPALNSLLNRWNRCR